MIILLLGFLGSGRTSVSTLLAKEMGYSFIEMDDVILEKTGYDNVNEAYEKEVTRWKEMELETCKELSYKDNIIIASTGALVENELNITYFRNRKTPFVAVYLKTSKQELTKRLIALYEGLSQYNPRMVLKRMSSHFDRRDQLYNHFSDIVVETDNQTPEDTCRNIQAKLKKI